MNGIVNVLKPPGMTSHDIVYFIRKRFKQKKVGHTGTLDPEAAGVLPVCIGKATKAVQYITDKTKKYRANVKFGIETETYDKYGRIIAQHPVSSLDEAQLKELLRSFVGEIDQYPPIYSAIKYDGKKLYQYALEGQEVELRSRRVEIYKAELVDIISEDEIMIDVECSKGTYIRSLCYDLGKKLGCGAHMSQLIRVSSTPFLIEEAYTLEEIDKAAAEGRLSELLRPVELAFEGIESVSVKPTARQAVLNGNPIYEKGLIDEEIKNSTEELIRLYDGTEFLGLGIIKYSMSEDRKYIKIEKLFQ